MCKTLLATAACAALLTSSPAVAREVMIVLDFSNSFPLTDPDSGGLSSSPAERAGRYVEELIAELEIGDTIKIRSFGLQGVGKTQLFYNIALTNRYRPARAGQEIGNLIASIPEGVRDGKIKVEDRTDLIGFMETTASSLDCSEDGTMLIISDGIQWSDSYQGPLFLEGVPLPDPSSAFLEGCTIEMRGVGADRFGTSDMWVNPLRQAWTVYFEKAGAAAFSAHARFLD